MTEVHVTYQIEDEFNLKIPDGTTEGDRSGIIARAIDDHVRNRMSHARVNFTIMVVPEDAKKE